MKKFFAILLALVMTLSLGAAVFAAPPPAPGSVPANGEIIIANPADGKEYNVYKIFDAEPTTADPTTYSYTIKAESPWFATVDAAEGLTLTKANDSTKIYYVTFAPTFKPAVFANALNAALDAMAPAPAPDATLNKANPKSGELPYGYYFVTTGTGTVCSLDTNCPYVEIHDKNEQPTIDKDITNLDDGTFDVGSTVKFQVKGTVPVLTGYEEYHYNVSDTMTALTYDGKIKVTIGETVVYCTLDGEAPVVMPAWMTFTSDAASFNLEMNLVAAVEAVDTIKTGDQILIEYAAVINEEAIVTNEAKNKAHLDYSDDPTDGSSTKPSVPEPEVAVHTYDIEVNKTDGTSHAALPNAEFVLYKVVEGVNKYYQIDTAKNVTWVDTQEEATVLASDTDGNLSFTGLEAGTYYLHETKAPEGYNLLTEDIEVVVSNADVPVPVLNFAGSELPSTGGIGTTIFYVIGGLLMVGAAVLLIVRKKMSVED